MPLSPAPEASKPLPAWVVPALSLLLGVGSSLATFSYKIGHLETQAQANKAAIADLQAYNRQRDSRDAARLEQYERERADRLARIERIADQLTPAR